MLLEESVNAQSPGHSYPICTSKGIATLSRMSTFSADWTTIAAMLQCHAGRFGSRPAILGEGGQQLSHQEMHAPTATLSLELPLSLLFRLPTRALLARGWMNCSLLGKSICSRPKKSC